MRGCYKKMYLYVYECPKGIITATKKTILVKYSIGISSNISASVRKIVEYDAYVMVYYSDVSAYIIHKENGLSFRYTYFVHIVYDQDLYIWYNTSKPFKGIYNLTVNHKTNHLVPIKIDIYLDNNQHIEGHNNILVVPLVPLVRQLNRQDKDYSISSVEYSREIWTSHEQSLPTICCGFKDIYIVFQ